MANISDRPEKKKNNASRLTTSILSLVLKLLIIAIIAYVLLNYVFGLERNLSQNMQPALQDGDLLFYYRIVNDYTAGDVVVVEYEGNKMASRVAAVAGDTVDITADGLTINGALVQEPGVWGPTTPFEGGEIFPLKVPSGHVFVLGDNRTRAIDSRIFGCVKESNICGRLIGLFRRRNF